MTHYELSWKWTLQSATHTGAGLSRPGVADSLVQFDHDKRPVLLGDAVKGALRLSAEQLLTWLTGASQEKHYVIQQTAEPDPACWPLARVFGGRAVAHCRPGTLVEKTAITAVFASTAINAESGTARTSTLRKTQFISKDATFQCGFELFLEEPPESRPEAFDPSIVLLVAALGACESIGGRTGVGWGLVKPTEIKLNRNNKKTIDPLQVVSQPNLDELKTILVTRRPAPNGPVRTLHVTGSPKMKWFRLDIVLQEPACFSTSPETGNQIESEEFIRAATIRGSMASFWRSRGCNEDVILRRLSEISCWSPGFRSTTDSITFAVPRSFTKPKRLSGNSPVVLRDEFDETKHEKGVKSKIVDRGQITFRNGTPEFLSPIKRLARMHIARNYETGSKRSGALFSRDGLVPGTQFTCWAYVPGDAFVSGEKWEWTFGKRKSAGNGRATIRAVEVNSPELFESVSKETCDVYVHLLSPLLLRDASGNPTRSMDKTLWKQLVGTLDLPDDTGFVAMTWNRRVGGWMSGWNHRRASVTVVAEGSVWRFRFNTQEAAKTMRTTLSTFLPQIGERRHEGFGWFALDPPWLGRGSNAAPVSQQTSPPERETTAELNREDRIIARMQTMPLNAGALKPLNELAARLREANESVLTPLKEYWHGRCNRENAGVWQHIAPETDVGRLLTGCWTNLEDLRFTIEALSIRATEKREG